MTCIVTNFCKVSNLLPAMSSCKLSESPFHPRQMQATRANDKSSLVDKVLPLEVLQCIERFGWPIFFFFEIPKGVQKRAKFLEEPKVEAKVTTSLTKPLQS